jgi:hypothetical protein
VVVLISQSGAVGRLRRSRGRFECDVAVPARVSSSAVSADVCGGSDGCHDPALSGTSESWCATLSSSIRRSSTRGEEH